MPRVLLGQVRGGWVMRWWVRLGDSCPCDGPGVGRPAKGRGEKCGRVEGPGAEAADFDAAQDLVLAHAREPRPVPPGLP